MEDVTNGSRLSTDAPSSKREKLSHDPLRALSLEKAETMPALKLRVKRIVAHTADQDAVKRSKVAKLPKRGSAGAAGYDLARCAGTPCCISAYGKSACSAFLAFYRCELAFVSKYALRRPKQGGRVILYSHSVLDMWLVGAGED